MNKKEIKEVIKADLYRYHGDISIKAFIKAFFRSPGFKYTFFLRKCFFYKNKGLKIKYFIFRLLLERYRFKYGFDIPYICKIGKGFYLGHFGGVVISVEASIGCNVNIAQGVTIGRTNRGNNKGAPHIGNRVWIGANAVVVGNIKIGNNVLIGPGSYINFDVSDNAVVIGNPGKIISYKGTEGYINRIVEED